MLSFATEFPVESTRSSLDFARAFRTWLLGSPHTQFRQDTLPSPGTDEWSARSENETLDALQFSSHSVEAAAFRYVKIDDAFEWTTSVVFSKQENTAWVGLSTWCECSQPAARLPAVKKPV